jgi:cation:H+ antiporter
MADVVWFVGGLILLVGGAELLVSGAVQIARRIGVSTLLIGLMVGLGTSTPELVTSVHASLAGAPGIALGNVVGANIANLLLVLGACALVRPVRVDARSLRFDGMVVLVTILLFAGIAAVIPLQRWVGLLFLILLAAYLFRTWEIERRHPQEHTAPFEMAEAAAEVIPLPSRIPAGFGAMILSLAQVIGGIALVALGARWLVQAAVALALDFGVTDSVVGLTVVAVGTTLPELATSIVAASRRNTDVALGNVFGSCVYNILGIAGMTALLAPTDVPAVIIVFGNPVMVAAAALMLVFAWTGFMINRREGAFLLVAYAVYVFASWQT